MVVPFLRILFKSSLGLVVVLSYIALGLFLYPYYKIKPYSARKLQNRILSFYCKVFLWILNVKVALDGKNFYDAQKNYLIVGNHMSYVDIFVLGAHIPTSFITSYEIKEMPLVGFLTEISGCVYVERRNRSNRERELDDIEKSLANGVNITLYPEATTSNGKQVLPFKKPMFSPAFKLDKPILLQVLNYNHVDGEQVSLENKDEIFWYDEMTLPSHLINFLSLKEVKVDLTLLEVVTPSKYQDIIELSNSCHKVVSQSYRSISA